MRKILGLMLVALSSISPSAYSAVKEADVSWTFATGWEDGTPLPLAQITATKIEWGVCASVNDQAKTAIWGTQIGVVDVPTPTASKLITPLPDGAPNQPISFCFRAYTVVGPSLSNATGPVYKTFYPLATVDLNASPLTVTDGDDVTLTWTSSNVTGTCTAGGDWSGSKAVSGTEILKPSPGSKNFTLSCTGQGGDVASDGVNVTVNYRAPTLVLAANPTTGIVGSNTTLTWNATNTTSCSASGAWTGTKGLTGTETLAIANVGSNTYTLDCTGPGGPIQKSVVVTGTNPAPTVMFTGAPSTVDYGASATLTWTSTNATACSATGDWTGSKDPSGSFVATNLTKNSSFGLTCTGPGGSVDATPVTITVKAPLPPTLTITATPNPVDINNTTTITWNAANVTSCTASGAWTGSKAATGTEVTGALSTNSTFTLSCTSPGGDISKSVDVTVRKPLPPTIRLSANPTVVLYGPDSGTVLTWSSDNASSCEASDAWSGTKLPFGEEIRSPSVDSTYALKCSGTGGDSSTSVLVDVQKLYVTPNTLVSSSTRTVWAIATERNRRTGVVTYRFWMPVGTIPVGKACKPNNSYGENLNANNPNRTTGETWYGITNSDVRLFATSSLFKQLFKKGLLAAPCDWK